jgi:hypothetical protein
MSKKPTTIKGHCKLHPGAKLICPVCAGRRGGRGRKGRRGQHALGLALFKRAKAMMDDAEEQDVVVGEKRTEG